MAERPSPPTIARRRRRSLLPVAAPLVLQEDRHNTQEVRIELIPLIDVIFCILTFFILAAVNFSRQQAINVNLPKANTGTPQMKQMLLVSLDDFGQIYVEKQAIASQNQLYQQLKNYKDLNPDGLLVLHASQNVTYQEVIRVLDMMREVGGEKVALATLQGEGNNQIQLNNLNGNPGVPNPNPNPNFNFQTLPPSTPLPNTNPGGSPNPLPSPEPTVPAPSSNGDTLPLPVPSPPTP